MRKRFGLLVLGLAFCLGSGTAHADADPARFAGLIDTLLPVVKERWDAYPADTKEGFQLRHWYSHTNHSTHSLGEELALGGRAVITLSDRIDGDTKLADAYEEFLTQAGFLIQNEIDYFNSWVVTLENENPELHLTKTKKLLVKAQDRLDRSHTQFTIRKRYGDLVTALGYADAADETFHLDKAPKSCKYDRKLLKGEFCSALSLSTGVFKANLGSATYRRDLSGNLAGANISFWYCNGRNQDLQWLDFRIVGTTPGTYAQDNNVGGFRQGLGFQLSLGAGSKVVVTKFDVDHQIIEGTFEFTASGTIFSGGQFRIAQIDAP